MTQSPAFRTFEDVVQEFLTDACRRMGLSLGHAFILDQSSRTVAMTPTGIWYSAHPGSDIVFREITESMKAGPKTSAVWKSYSFRAPIWSDERTWEDSFLRAPHAKQAGLKTCIMLPVHFEGLVRGVIELYSRSLLELDLGHLHRLQGDALSLGPWFASQVQLNALESKQEIFKASLEALSDPVVIYSLVRSEAGEVVDFVFEYLNRAACDAFQTSVHGYLGRRLGLVHPYFKVTPEFTEFCEVAAGTKNAAMISHQLEWMIDGRSVDRFYEIHLTKLEDGLLSTWRDVTARHQSEALVREQERALMSSFKMDALGQMSASIAHEVHNPLTVIVCDAFSMSRELKVEVPDRTKLNEWVSRIESTAFRIKRIIDGLRSFSQSGVGNDFEIVSLSEVFQGTLAFCTERMNGHGVCLDVAEIPPSLVLECQPVQISEVLLNLLNNAFDAVHGLPVRWVRVGVKDRGDEVDVTVTDSGYGIEPEVASRIFGAFFTTKPRGKGSGLGLSLSRQFIERHHGTLLINAQSLHTEFVIRLPKRQPALGGGRDLSESRDQFVGDLI